ncbi:MAG: 1,4-dihydroxy-6-naphthoate synthase [Candidatus Electrothrix sp. GW3-4]|uniref:1,4-dihydroxy-6-naphthoate synthase n=1 Tax=Candidatus Electrothrix sp. GW3-4 TaxID=3126740 RepID=UPI0030CBB770
MALPLSIGYSPCPNDTFIFYALMHGKIPLRHIQFTPPVLKDVETLNRWAINSRLDVTKVSLHALGHVQDSYTMLNAGAALGRGCGPLLITQPGQKTAPSSWRIAIPGKYTTAALLLTLFLPEPSKLIAMPFDTIMDAIKEGKVDAGVIIHESRFTYQNYGLVCVQDLGEWWEKETGLPIPLGCIAARKSLGQQTIKESEEAIAASLRWASAHPETCTAYIKQYAQELDDRVISEHIKLYVNNFSIDLTDTGRAAVQELLRRGKNAGIFTGASAPGVQSYV